MTLIEKQNLLKKEKLLENIILNKDNNNDTENNCRFKFMKIPLQQDEITEFEKELVNKYFKI